MSKNIEEMAQSGLAYLLNLKKKRYKEEINIYQGEGEERLNFGGTRKTLELESAMARGAGKSSYWDLKEPFVDAALSTKRPGTKVACEYLQKDMAWKHWFEEIQESLQAEVGVPTAPDVKEAFRQMCLKARQGGISTSHSYNAHEGTFMHWIYLDGDKHENMPPDENLRTGTPYPFFPGWQV
ncbi:MAG: hypothetical protein K9G62_00055 [Alphaproteobacteria bacterium]|nr:hypothetical protein [Alphaproteobacteria bacterium]